MRIEEAIGFNMARLREDAGLTQEQLGKALEPYLGKSWTRQAVSAAEKGRRSFTAAELIALGLALNTSLQFLLMIHPDWLTSLLPGSASVTFNQYEDVIAGRKVDGTPNAEGLARAHAALSAAALSVGSMYKAIGREFESQAVFLDNAGVILFPEKESSFAAPREPAFRAREEEE